MKYTFFNYALIILCFSIILMSFVACTSSSDDIDLEDISIEDLEEFHAALESAEADTVAETTPATTEVALPEIDVVTPIEKYFKWENADGFGQIQTSLSSNDGWVEYGEYQEVLFSYEDLYFTGNSGHISVVRNNRQIANIFFLANPSFNLSSGDSITITPEVRLFTSTEIPFSFPSKNITVPDLGKYAAAKEDMTPERLDQLKDQSLFEDAYFFGPDEFSVLHIYAAEIKPGKVLDNRSPFSIVFLLLGSNNKYYLLKMNDIILFSDGNVEISDIDILYSTEFNNQSFSTLESALEKLELDWWSKYDYAEIEQ